MIQPRREYDSTKTLTQTGRILASGYGHPHGHIRLERRANRDRAEDLR